MRHSVNRASGRPRYRSEYGPHGQPAKLLWLHLQSLLVAARQGDSGSDRAIALDPREVVSPPHQVPAAVAMLPTVSSESPRYLLAINALRYVVTSVPRLVRLVKMSPCPCSNYEYGKTLRRESDPDTDRPCVVRDLPALALEPTADGCTRANSSAKRVYMRLRRRSRASTGSAESCWRTFCLLGKALHVWAPREDPSEHSPSERARFQIS